MLVIIFHWGRVIVNFVLKFVAIAMGWQGRNFNDTIGSPKPENRGAGANRAQLFFTETKLYHFKISIGCNAKFCNF